MNPPYQIGSTWWQPVVSPTRVEVPCPVCCGKLAVTLILGDGTEVGIACDACGKGHSSPQGTVSGYVREAGALEVTILRTMRYDVVHDERGEAWWIEVASPGRQNFQVDFASLRPTREEALEHSRIAMEKMDEDERAQRAGLKKRDRLDNYAWNAYYHKKQIEELERSLAWHKAKLTAAPERRRQ